MHKKSIKSRLKCLFTGALALALVPAFCSSAFAVENQFKVQQVQSKEEIESSLLADTGSAKITDIRNMQRQMGVFSGGLDSVGMDSGFVISTGDISKIVGNNTRGNDTISKTRQPDHDLTRLSSNNQYDTAIVEFTLKNTSNKDAQLSFDYSIGSAEFDNKQRFRDTFGLFVDYDMDNRYDENIAVLPNGKVASIKEIRKGNYYTGEDCRFVNSFNGMSYVFTAKTSRMIKSNQSVRLKIAIADIGNAEINSAVFIKARSIVIGKKIEPPVISGGDTPGVVLTPEFEDKETTCTYQWYVSDKMGEKGTKIEGETSETYTVTKDMVGKYISLEATGTGNYTGTVRSNYILITEKPLIKVSFSYYTSFMYTEPYRLTAFGKGDNLTAYFIRSKEALTPTAQQMIDEGIAIKCDKKKTINGAVYSGAEFEDKILTHNLGDHIYVMFAEEKSDGIYHSGIKDRQLVTLFDNAKALGFSQEEADICTALSTLYKNLKTDEYTYSNITGLTVKNSVLAEVSKVSDIDTRSNVTMRTSAPIGFKMTAGTEQSFKDCGFVVYSCKNGNLSESGYNRNNLPSAENLLKFAGTKVYSLSSGNTFYKNGTVTAFCTEDLNCSTLNTDYIFSFWTMDNNGDISMEKPYYINLYDQIIKEKENVSSADKTTLQCVLDVYNAVVKFCK